LLAEEVDKLQNGSKESTPDVCPEYTRKSSISSEEGQSSAPPYFPTPLVPVSSVTNSQHDRKSVIETSTDTLVPDSEKTSGVTNQSVITSRPPVEEVMNISSSSSSAIFSDPLDSDGLVSHHNQLQRRMVEIFSSHSAEVSALRRDLHMSRLALTQAGLKADQGIVRDIGEEELAMLERGSGVESTTSEVSWEAVDERETRPTLWVPDHAASQCMGCHTQFWFGRRKHHCRSCGRLFCSECSENYCPIPEEQLFHDVRVCDQCFLERSDSSKTFGSEEQAANIVITRTENNDFKHHDLGIRRKADLCQQNQDTCDNKVSKASNKLSEEVADKLEDIVINTDVANNVSEDRAVCSQEIEVDNSNNSVEVEVN